VGEYLDHVRRLSAFLFIVAVVLVLAAIQMPASGVENRLPIYVLLGLAFATGVGVYWFPWRRYHPNWFLVIGVLATLMTAILIALTGGRGSIFYPIYFFIVVAAGAYYGATPLAFLTIVVSAASASYMLYQTPTEADRLRSAFEIPTYFVVAFLCHLIYRHLEQSVAHAAHAEAQREVAELREQFVDEANHELRTPLTSLLIAAEFLGRENLTAEQQAKYVGYVQTSGRHLKQIFDDLLTLARIERGKTPIEPRPVFIPDLVREAIEEACPPGREDRIRLAVLTPIPPVAADPDRMREVFSNLLGNALKYSPGDSPVAVECEDGTGEVVVRVSDQGIGIPPMALPHVFDRFFRANNSRERSAPGSGLGLTIARELVLAHGGNIRADSAGEGRGSTFTVTLPALEPAELP